MNVPASFPKLIACVCSLFAFSVPSHAAPLTINDDATMITWLYAQPQVLPTGNICELNWVKNAEYTRRGKTRRVDYKHGFTYTKRGQKYGQVLSYTSHDGRSYGNPTITLKFHRSGRHKWTVSKFIRGENLGIEEVVTLVKRPGVARSFERRYYDSNKPIYRIDRTHGGDYILTRFLSAKRISNSKKWAFTRKRYIAHYTRQTAKGKRYRKTYTWASKWDKRTFKASDGSSGYIATLDDGYNNPTTVVEQTKSAAGKYTVIKWEPRYKYCK